MELLDDLVLEILIRVAPADAATYFRCATACKRWRALVADPSFVRRRQRALLDGLGMPDAEWALSKVARQSDVQPDQNRLLIISKVVRAGLVPRLFPELEQAGGGGTHSELAVALLDVDAGVEKAAVLHYLYRNSVYRIRGRRWREFVAESGISKGDRLDVYACRRGAGELCLLFFNNRKRAQG